VGGSTLLEYTGFREGLEHVKNDPGFWEMLVFICIRIKKGEE
jgi:hypothetical protein